jgi:hypothetical protein
MKLVGPRGLEPRPGSLRGSCAATNTLDPQTGAAPGDRTLISGSSDRRLDHHSQSGKTDGVRRRPRRPSRTGASVFSSPRHRVNPIRTGKMKMGCRVRLELTLPDSQSSVRTLGRTTPQNGGGLRTRTSDACAPAPLSKRARTPDPVNPPKPRPASPGRGGVGTTQHYQGPCGRSNDLAWAVPGCWELHQLFGFQRTTAYDKVEPEGFEPSSEACKATVLPLN